MAKKKPVKVPDEVQSEPGLEGVYPEALLPVGRVGSAAKGASKFLQGNEYADYVISAAEKPYLAAKKAAGFKSGGKVKARGCGIAVKGHTRAK